MKRYFPAALLLSSLHSSIPLAATQIYQCIATDGTISFSDNICPADTKQNIHTLLQPMLIPTLSKQAIRETSSNTSQQRGKTRVTVVGESAHRCGESNPYERRTAMVRKQVKSGMNQADIESMYGKPIKSNLSNGIVTAVYRSKKGQNRSVRFDEHGCVYLKQKSAKSRNSTNKHFNKKKQAKKNLQ